LGIKNPASNILAGNPVQQ
jgi:hypothetical protein